MNERDITYEEAATWGECPVCHAQDGEACDWKVGVPLGHNINGSRPTEGAHMARLFKAPKRVKLVAA
jgi:hypothetical protein